MVKQLHITVPENQAIRYWMRAPVVTINVAQPVSDALELMQEHSVRRLPVVVDSGKLCGMITQGDIRGADVLRAAGIDIFEIADALRHVKVYDVMTKHPQTLTEETGLREAALLMIENKIGGLPVVDAEQRVIGIVTESDLFEALVQQLDQTVAPSN